MIRGSGKVIGSRGEGGGGHGNVIEGGMGDKIAANDVGREKLEVRMR